MAELDYLKCSELSGRVAESGIRVRLRSVSLTGWEFESPHAHSVQNGVVSEAYGVILGSSSLPMPTMIRKDGWVPSARSIIVRAGGDEKAAGASAPRWGRANF